MMTNYEKRLYINEALKAFVSIGIGFMLGMLLGLLVTSPYLVVAFLKFLFKLMTG
jgi:hypothetical protein